MVNLLFILLMFFHFFHMVEISPWPIFMGILSLNMMLTMIMMFKFNLMKMLYLSLSLLSLFMLLWFRDICRESVYTGSHSYISEYGFQLGMVLFIFSEVMFFASFFWTFFHSSGTPNIEIGSIWPPDGINSIQPFSIPLLNTLVLLGSGVSVTMAHYSILSNLYGILMMGMTVMLGMYFTFLQGMEYMICSYSFADSTFGSIFFMATGFHGAHVIIGSIMLMVSTYRLMSYQLTMVTPIGLEMSIWYWHFVDVVWLFLFSFIYWWGY